MHEQSLRTNLKRPSHDIIVIGGSSGSIEALLEILPLIPADIPAAIFVVVHTSPDSPYRLPEVFRREVQLDVTNVEDKMPIVYGRIYVARPDLHLLMERDYIRVVFGAKENRYRPAIDPLFRSAARAHGPHVVGVLLSGALDDGVAGLWDIHCCGGVTVVQDPNSACSSELIQNALDAMDIDHVAEPVKLARLLSQLTRTEPKAIVVDDANLRRIELETGLDSESRDHARVLDQVGQLSGLTCPGCGGPLWKIKNKAVERYRCRVGHAYSRAGLFQSCWESSERKLYSALQMLEENAQLGRRVLESSAKAGHLLAAGLREQVALLEEEADTIRNLLVKRAQKHQTEIGVRAGK